MVSHCFHDSRRVFNSFRFLPILFNTHFTLFVIQLSEWKSFKTKTNPILDNLLYHIICCAPNAFIECNIGLKKVYSDNYWLSQMANICFTLIITTLHNSFRIFESKFKVLVHNSWVIRYFIRLKNTFTVLLITLFRVNS